jgi:hypothetical protein
VLYNLGGPPDMGNPLDGPGLEGGEPATVVAPLGGRLLLFDSRLAHEVLPAQRHRQAAAGGWREEAGSCAGSGAGGASNAWLRVHACRYAITAWFSRQQPGDLTPTPQPQPQPQPPAQQGFTDPSAIASASLCPAPQPHAQPPAASPAVAAAAAAGPEPGPAPEPRQRIFVSVASFRDPETQWTLHSLFSMAAHPERVFVGVVWQVGVREGVVWQVGVREAGWNPEGAAAMQGGCSVGRDSRMRIACMPCCCHA